MPPPDAGNDITVMLRRLSDGRPGAADDLAPLIYSELRSLAARCMRRERSSHTLQPTALVNEAYLRLIGQHDVQWQNRAHFFSVAARVMRRVLLDFARKRLSARRGGDLRRVTLDQGLSISTDRLDDILLIDEALIRLAQLDERQSRIVELRFFAGLSVEDIAGLLGISQITVKRDWNSAKAWLKREISGVPPETSSTAVSLDKGKPHDPRAHDPRAMAAGQTSL